MPMVMENFAIVLVGLFCMLYEQSSRATIMLMCDQCLREWHMGMKYQLEDGLLLMCNINLGNFIVR
jgi:hypothetical protein